MVGGRLCGRTCGSVRYAARQLFGKLHDQRERVSARRALMDDRYVGKEGVVDESDLAGFETGPRGDLEEFVGVEQEMKSASVVARIRRASWVTISDCLNSSAVLTSICSGRPSADKAARIAGVASVEP